MEQELQVGDQRYWFRPLQGLDVGGDVAGLPYSLKVLLENLVRHVDGVSVTDDDVAALASWDPTAPPPRELAFAPARILLAGTMDLDIYDEPLGTGPDGGQVFLRDLWPSTTEVAEAIGDAGEMVPVRTSPEIADDCAWHSPDRTR